MRICAITRAHARSRMRGRVGSSKNITVYGLCGDFNHLAAIRLTGFLRCSYSRSYGSFPFSAGLALGRSLTRHRSVYPWRNARAAGPPSHARRPVHAFAYPASPKRLYARCVAFLRPRRDTRGIMSAVSLAADREYAIRRLGEAREIEAAARAVREEIESAIGTPDGPRGADLARWAEFCVRRREQLRHIGIELDLVVSRPTPDVVYLPVWVRPPAWWAAVVAAITSRVGWPAAPRPAGPE